MHSGGLFVPVRPTLAIGTVQVKPFPLWSKTMQLMNVSNEVTMTSREIADLVEARHDNVMVSIRKLIDEGILSERTPTYYIHPQNGQKYPQLEMNYRDTMVVASGYKADMRAKIIDRWMELEASKKKDAPAIPDFSNPAAAARAWADAFEKQQAAIALANHAIATKAEIGNRREATAMNTASQAVKKATALEIQLDRSKEYASIKRMEMLYHGQKFEWRKLKATGQEMGIEPIEIFDANYGTVKAYHKDVWRETYALDIE